MKVVWEDHEAALETIALWAKALPQETNNKISDTVEHFNRKSFFLQEERYFLLTNFAFLYLSSPVATARCWEYDVQPAGDALLDSFSFGAISKYIGKCGQT